MDSVAGWVIESILYPPLLIGNLGYIDMKMLSMGAKYNFPEF